MEFCLLVNKGPYSHQAAHSAYHFAAAALEKGHKIPRIFFYQDGAYNASRLAQIPTDEFALTPSWNYLAQQYQIELCVCINAGVRRGILDDKTAQIYQQDSTSIDPNFQLTGLGQLLEAIIAADRLVVFGN